MEEKKIVIEAKNLVKTYGEGEAKTFALNDVSINVYEHDFLVILGGSGSGKSTFLNMIGAIDKVERGEILVNGRDITKVNDKELTLYRRNEIGFVYQFFKLIWCFDLPKSTLIQVQINNGLFFYSRFL